jgi:hypothetical protein
MKLNRSILLAFGLLILASSLYRIWEGRPFGFAPQLAMAIFAGAVVKDRKWSFLLPLLSMFISDALYEVLYMNGLSPIYGFYEGQITNYILFTAMTVFGFMARNVKPGRMLLASLAAPTAYFLLSNLTVWMSNSGYQRPKTFDGLMMTYADGLPFYGYSLLATVVFSSVFFGVYAFFTKTESKVQTA